VFVCPPVCPRSSKIGTRAGTATRFRPLSARKTQQNQLLSLPLARKIVRSSRQLGYELPADLSARGAAMVRDQFAVPIAAAALWFPFAHPAIATVLADPEVPGELDPFRLDVSPFLQSSELAARRSTSSPRSCWTTSPSRAGRAPTRHRVVG
jgi:hypothetical protein